MESQNTLFLLNERSDFIVSITKKKDECQNFDDFFKKLTIQKSQPTTRQPTQILKNPNDYLML